MPYQIAIAGSTHYTVQMAQALANDSRFELAFTLSPEPKTIGRQQILTKNPLHQWSLEQNLAHLLVEKKIDDNLHQKIQNLNKKIDFLLVVDFGYLVPQWLLDLAQIAPLNIHPSLLPKWRGSSPGQFALLMQNLMENGQKSAITLMVMNAGLDQGPIISQLPFTIDSAWTQTEYYQTAFNLIAAQLGDLISSFAEGKIKAQAQPLESPTFIARRLNKEDSFITWQDLQLLMDIKDEKIKAQNNHSALLYDLLGNLEICPTRLAQIKLVTNASRAFDPWPILWTLVQTSKGEKRMKILESQSQGEQLLLTKVQIEGKNPCSFNECKNSIL